MKRVLLGFILGFAIAGSAAPPIQLSQIQSRPYPGVMVNTGNGWVQAELGPNFRILLATNPPTLDALPGAQGPPGPPGPPGASAPVLPIKITADGGIQVVSLTTGAPGAPTAMRVTQADGTVCTMTFQAGQMKLAC